MSFLASAGPIRLGKRPLISCGAVAGPSRAYFRPLPRLAIALRDPRSRSCDFSSIQARHLSSTLSRSFPPPNSKPASHSPATPRNTAIDPSTSVSKTESTQAKTDWRIILKLAENIWPANSPTTKIRVLGALSLLVAGKVLNVQVPFFFKGIVDGLNVAITPDSTVYLLAGTAIMGCE
jgi:ATP-binding cassette subfamily B (MDR/TAP) protein 7